MRGRIVLHLLTGGKLIGPGARLGVVLPQIEAADDSGQGTVGNSTAILVLEDLLHPDHIALGDLEYLLDDGGKLLIGRFPQGSLLPLSPDDPSDRVTREFEDLADLPDLYSLLIKAPNGLLALLADHRDHTSGSFFPVPQIALDCLQRP
jgi:hypothetical protein